MELTDIQQRFVIHWGEMGSAWGVNRTVAQIHALLFTIMSIMLPITPITPIMYLSLFLPMSLSY